MFEVCGFHPLDLFTHGAQSSFLWKFYVFKLYHLWVSLIKGLWIWIMLGFYEMLVDYAWLSISSLCHKCFLSIETMHVLSYETMVYYEIWWWISRYLTWGFYYMLVGWFTLSFLILFHSWIAWFWTSIAHPPSFW